MTAENNIDIIKDLDLKDLCLNEKKFGPLTFNRAHQFLEKIRGELVELEELDYKNQLAGGEVRKISSVFSKFRELITRIKDFQIGVGDSQTIHNSIEADIETFYNEQFSDIYTGLSILRQNIQFKNKTEKELQESLKKAKKYETDLQTMQEQLSETLKKVKKETQEVEEGKGILSSKYLSQEFENQFIEHEKKADIYWFPGTKLFYYILITWLALSLILYITFIRNVKNDFIIYEYAIINLLSIAVIYYGLNFCTRNYNIQKNLATLNRHRRNVAQTMENYLSLGSNDAETKNALLKEASRAMFEKSITGYLAKNHSEISTPTQDLIKIVTGSSKE